MFYNPIRPDNRKSIQQQSVYISSFACVGMRSLCPRRVPFTRVQSLTRLPPTHWPGIQSVILFTRLWPPDILWRLAWTRFF